MKFIEVPRTSLFKGEYPYKAHFRVGVSWDGTRERWHNSDDKEYMEYAELYLKNRNPKDFIRQGAVIYMKNLDVAYMVRMYFEDKLIKIEKAKIK